MCGSGWCWMMVWCLWCVERALGRSWFGHRFVTCIIIGMEYGFGDTQVYQCWIEKP